VGNRQESSRCLTRVPATNLLAHRALARTVRKVAREVHLFASEAPWRKYVSMVFFFSSSELFHDRWVRTKYLTRAQHSRPRPPKSPTPQSNEEQEEPHVPGTETIAGIGKTSKGP